jgi:hypothetical protein
MSAFGTNAYESARPTGVCALTGRAIQVGDPYIATLVEREGQDRLERVDYSLEAWQGGARPSPPLRLLGFWKTMSGKAAGKQRVFVDDDALVDLFEQLGEAGAGDEGAASKRATFRFLLALILIRKRLLRYEGTKGGLMLVRWAKGGAAAMAAQPVIEVTDPGLSDESIAEAVEQIGEVIFGDSGAPVAGAGGEGSAGA